MGRTCFCPGCKSGYESERKKTKKMPSFFQPPKDPYYFELWKRAIPRADKSLAYNSYVCEKHFKQEDIMTHYETIITDGTIFRLARRYKKPKPGAIPCIFPNVPGHSSFSENNLTKSKKKCWRKDSDSLPFNTQKQLKKNISCSDNARDKKDESSCQTEKENILLEVITIHSIPEKPSAIQSSFLKERQNVANASNSSLSYSQSNIVPETESSVSIHSPPAPDEITENHSPQNQSHEILAETSTSNKLTETENCSKQCSSIETIAESPVPDLLTESSSDQNICDMAVAESPTHGTPSENYSDITDCDKTLAEFSRVNELTQNHSDQSICDIDMTESNNIISESSMIEQVSFELLKANASMFETDNSWWRVNTFEDFIAFFRWTSDYNVERRIVITKDLAVKVYLKDKEIKIGSDLNEFSLFDITKLIYRVENLKICSGIDRKEGNCAGFLECVFMCKRYNLCLNCIKWRKEQKMKTIKELKKSKNCIELMTFNLIS